MNDIQIGGPSVISLVPGLIHGVFNAALVDRFAVYTQWSSNVAVEYNDNPDF